MVKDENENFSTGDFEKYFIDGNTSLNEDLIRSMSKEQLSDLIRKNIDPTFTH